MKAIPYFANNLPRGIKTWNINRLNIIQVKTCELTTQCNTAITRQQSNLK